MSTCGCLRAARLLAETRVGTPFTLAPVERTEILSPVSVEAWAHHAASWLIPVGSRNEQPREPKSGTCHAKVCQYIFRH